MKKWISSLLLVILFVAVVSAQEILTAAAFFKSVSEYYGTIRDYEAQVTINQGGTNMAGQVSFKRPELLRIDFTTPRNQVVVYNGDMLTIFLPDRQAVLTQSASSAGRTGTIATSQGLNLLNRYYTVAYETGQDAVPLDGAGSDMVVKLILTRRTVSEEFSSIRLSIDPGTKLIRRVEATTNRGLIYIFNFSNYLLNQGIPDQRFVYTAPVAANEYNNFLLPE
jgi:outer membrane lipoprotein-sorting protein